MNIEVFVQIFLWFKFCTSVQICIYLPTFVLIYSWVSRDVINFTGGQLQIDTQSLKENNFLLYVLTFCLAANMCNFVRFVHSSTVL